MEKYLDKEDIATLGFQLIGYPITNEKTGLALLDFEHKEWSVKLFYERYPAELHNIYIRIFSLDEQVFVGTLKNKSELSKLLKQLGIHGQI